MNSRLDTIQAAILEVKLSAFADYELDGVNKAADMYTQLLGGIVDTPVIPDNFYSSWAQYTLRLPDEQSRNRLKAALEAKGIPTMVYYPKCMHQQGAFSHLTYNGECPNAEKLCKTVLSLPMHPYLQDDEVKQICKEIASVSLV